MIVSNYAIKFRTAVFVFAFVLIATGIQSYVTLPREGMPDITIPYVFVTAIYEGTAPSEMEKLVTAQLEKRLNDLEGVKEIRSSTAEGVCSISIEFMAGEDIDQARQRAKDKVDLARADLPDDIDEPMVDAFNISSDAPIFICALWGDATIERLKNLAEDIRDEAELVSGVREAVITGVREREIRVELDLRRIAALGVPLGLVMQRIAAENVTVSAGNIEMIGSKFQVRVPGEYERAFELRDLVLTEGPSGRIALGDVADVTDTYKDLSSISRLNGKPCVSVQVKKRSGENSVALLRKVKAIIDGMTMPPGIQRTNVYDESEYVAMMIAELENNIVSGFILVVTVLLIFMGARNSLFVGLAIPFSLLLAFTVMSVMRFSMNMIVLFSLVLAVGMLVDNAIVIVENIYRHRTLGDSRVEAARVGTAEVAWPVITSTLTTCAAFAPLLFWPDIMGQFMGFLPRTLIVVLAASLFVAMVINPAMCAALLNVGRRGAIGNGRRGGHPFVQGYERLLRGALRHRVVVFLLGCAFLVLTVGLYGRFGRGVELFPDVSPRNAVVQVKFPQGTSIERTDAAMRKVEALLPKYHDIEFFLTTVGQGAGQQILGAGVSGSHQGSIHVEFLDYEDREGDSAELVRALRDEIGTIAGAEVKVEKQEEGPPTGAPISIELSGEDFDVLSSYAAEIKRAIETVPGLVDLDDDFEEALPELQFRLNRNRIAALGLDTSTIGLFLRTAIYGVESSRLRVDEDEFDITLRLPPRQRQTARLLDEVVIPTAAGSRVPLSSLGSFVYTGGRGSISRKDQKRVITITGNNQGRGVDEILRDVMPRVERIRLPKGYAVHYAGDTEEMEKSGAFLARAFAVAVGLILVILVVQFNSALRPLIIMFSVAMSLIGVMWGLLICRMKFGVIMTGLGVISLAGIVVNNAIVLVDCIRQRCEEGIASREAVVEAGKLRLRPVLLTAVTTILGLIPMAVGYSVNFHVWPPRFVAGAESSQWWAPMAVAVIFGLGLATVLTLVLVPVMYSLADSFTAWLRRLFGRGDEAGR